MLIGARNAMLAGESAGPTPPAYWWGLTFTSNEPGVVVNMLKTGSPNAVTLQYCPGSLDWTNDANWTSFDADDNTTPITLTNAGDKVYFRAGASGNTQIAKLPSAYRRFTLSKSCSASGNIMSLLTRNENDWQSVRMASYCYSNMFQGCTSLTSAPELPATTLAGGCYSNMFQGCTALASAPELPATTLAGSCYSHMFQRCTSLTSAPELPATTLADSCYSYMFYGCTSLASAPELPATTLAGYCYSYMFQGCTALASAPELPATTLAMSCYSYMFQGCTSLASAPELPATTLAGSCYSHMFQRCTSLASAPELPATTLAGYCYSYMFHGCTSLASAPELPATTLADSCYSYMFYGCTSLYSVEVAFIDWNTSENGTTNWLGNVASLGTFTCPSGLDTTTRDATHVPSGWAVNYIS